MVKENCAFVSEKSFMYYPKNTCKREKFFVSNSKLKGEKKKLREKKGKTNRIKKIEMEVEEGVNGPANVLVRGTSGPSGRLSLLNLLSDSQFFFLLNLLSHALRTCSPLLTPLSLSQVEDKELSSLVAARGKPKSIKPRPRSTRSSSSSSNGGTRRPLRLPGPPLPLHLLLLLTIMLLPLPPRRRLRAAPPARLTPRHAPLRRGALLPFVRRPCPRETGRGAACLTCWVSFGVVRRWRGRRRSGGAAALAAAAAAAEGARWPRQRVRIRGFPSTSRSRRCEAQ